MLNQAKPQIEKPKEARNASISADLSKHGHIPIAPNSETFLSRSFARLLRPLTGYRKVFDEKRHRIKLDPGIDLHAVELLEAGQEGGEHVNKAWRAWISDTPATLRVPTTVLDLICLALIN